MPEAVRNFHYDQVHQFFRSGRAAMTWDWPGYYGSYRDPSSPVHALLRVARMPAGPAGRVCCYAGSHTFALTHAGAASAGARELLRFLTAPGQQLLEARQGSVPVRLSVMAQQQAEARGDDAHRLALLSRSIEHDLILPPKLPYYPRIEDILWRSVRAGMIGEATIPDTLRQIERQIAECVASE